MEPDEYNALIEIIDKQSEAIEIQKSVLEKYSCLIELKNQRIELQAESISKLN